MDIWAYIISSIIWIVFIFHWIFGSIPKRRIFEIYAGFGISFCLTLLIFGLFGWYKEASIQVIQVFGNILLFLAILLSFISLITLRIKGKPEKGFEDTNVLIEGTVFRVIRHPLYLGLSIWGVSQILSIQSIVSIIFGILALFCFWMSSIKEDEFNIRKFGDSYMDYMEKVPRINFLLGLIRLFRVRK
jgi:protein-S-isoprenylcysteine O-methyltransferase Ste14